MMKKVIPLLFTVLCLLLCVIPSLGMIVAPSTQTIGNEKRGELPSLKNEDGSLNSDYPEQAGDYYSKQFALRAQAVDLDAQVQSGVFRTSNLDTVTVGSDGWLYYSSTLDDYLGRNTLSRREVNGIVHNLLLAQEYVESQGGSFLFTIAPNKNTLYPAHMPYYYSKASSDVRNRDLFTEAVGDSGLNYCDLFTLFQSQDEVLYLKQDSHWNNKGALLAFNSIRSANRTTTIAKRRSNAPKIFTAIWAR